MLKIFRQAKRNNTDAGGSKSLDEIGLHYRIDQSSTRHDYLRLYEPEIASVSIPVKNIVIISGQDQHATAQAFAEFYSNATVHLISRFDMHGAHPSSLPGNVQTFSTAKTIDDIHSLLSELPRPEVIIEDGSNRKSEKIRLFQELFFYIPDGGKYIVEDLHASFIPSLNDIPGEDVMEIISRLINSKRSHGYVDSSLTAQEKYLADAMKCAATYGKIVFVTKSGDHLFKLRHDDTNRVLQARYQSDWGSNILTIPPASYKPNHRIKPNIPNHSHRFIETIETPALNLRRYEWPRCGHRQTCIFGDYILPDTFRHGKAKNLGTAALNDVTSRFATIRNTGQPRTLHGEYFYFDTEYPGHFGHIMTEVVGKIWAWHHAKTLHPNIKPLVSLPQGKSSIPDFQLRIFESIGINESDIEYIRYNESVDVENLLSCTPQFSNPYWADKSLAKIWSDIRAYLVPSPSSERKKIFITRVSAGQRSCNNTSEVEAKFAEHGFDIVFPEALPFEEQIDLFMNADVIAGFGGSGMFNMMFAKSRGVRIIIAGENYIAMNEYLISSVLDEELYYFWCPSDIKYPKTGWTGEAFKSNFTFDFVRDGDHLDELLTKI